MRRLSPEQMADVALAALSNARRLLDDADLLRNAGRGASAYILGGLAADELGKHVLAASFYGRDDTAEEWRKFWTRFRRHQEKLGNTLISAWVGDLLADEAPPDVEGFHQRRLGATYVDIRPEGTIAVPDEIICEEDLENLLQLVRRELSFCETVLRGADCAQLAATFREIRASELAREMREAQQRSPIGPVALALAPRSGLDPNEALQFLADVERSLAPHEIDITDDQNQP